MSNIVYILEHVAEYDNGHEDIKRIGIFANLEDAQNAQNQVKDKSGFREFPDGFHIDELTVGFVSWKEGFVGTITDEEWENWGNENSTL